MRRFPRLAAVWFSAALATILAARDGRAAGFAIFEHGARGLGSAFAGETALAEDPATVFFNPAGMTALRGTQLLFAGDVVLPTIFFDNQGSTLNPAVGGGPLRGNNGGDAGGTGMVPSFYLTHALFERWSVGLGIDAPFGLRTDYDPGWVGRYHAVVSDLKTININPSIAYRLLDRLSLGAGLSIQYVHVKLTNFLDLGSLCTLVQGLPPATCAALGLPPQSADAYVNLTGSDWSLGYNVGALFEPWTGTRIGLAYRSRVQHTLSGGADFSVPSQAQALIGPTGQLRDTGATARVTFPDSAALGIFQQLTPEWAIFGDLTWTHWDLFRQLQVDFANPKQTDFTQPANWRDSWRGAVGARWDPHGPWSFRVGSAFDSAAVDSRLFRNPRIPDSDRVWLALGAGYFVRDWLRVDMSYAHIFVLPAGVRNSDPVSGAVLRGEISGRAEVLGMQATALFD